MNTTDLSLPEKVLLDAGDAIRERLKEHGNTERSFQMIADLWSAYINHSLTSRGDLRLRPYDIAQMMALTKMARSVYGFSEDNFVDGAGYTALAALLHPRTAKIQPTSLYNHLGDLKTTVPVNRNRDED